MSAAAWVEVMVCASPFVGVPLMIWRDPANLRSTTEREEES